MSNHRLLEPITGQQSQNFQAWFWISVETNTYGEYFVSVFEVSYLNIREHGPYDNKNDIGKFPNNLPIYLLLNCWFPIL